MGMQSDDQSSGQGLNESQKEDKRPPFTMAGVLHYLQHEWSKYEAEKARWEMERAELQARISFLQGERRGQENLKNDLVRRIKMLEYCLKQERAKNYRLLHNGEDPPCFDEAPSEDANLAETANEIDSHVADGGAITWKQGRQLLKQYLQEIGFTETVMDVRSFRVKNMLGLLGENEWQAANERAKGSHKNDDDSDYYDEDRNRLDFDDDAAEALDEFNFLKDEKGKDEWASTDHNAIDRLKEKYKSERNKRHSTSTDDEDRPANTSRNEDIDVNLLPQKTGKKTQYRDIDNALGIPTDERVDISATDSFQEDNVEFANTKWVAKTTLRAHWDSLRAMQFHPVEPVVFTASEDSTVKMWLLDGLNKPNDKASVDGIDPLYTFRGHMGPVLCMDLSPTGDMLYTAGRDGKICCWQVPSTTSNSLGTYDSRILKEQMRGHTNAIWSIAFHSSDNRLVSASADETIRLWEPGNFGEPLLRTIDCSVENLIPTSVDFVSTEPSQLLAAFQTSVARIIDIETGATLLNFDFAGENAGLLTRIISHPTMPMAVVAGSDRKIRYFDNLSGKVTHVAVAHVEAISCLAIDPNGLCVLSGSHDGSLRLWNIEHKVCLQEISAHRKKFDASVNCVAFHPSHPMIGSGGADALAKIYMTSSD